MRARFAWIVAFVLVVSLLSGVHQLHAVITAPTPLSKFEGDAVYILVGKVEKYYPEKPAMMVKPVEDIKGKAPFRQLPINCKVADEKDFKANQIEPLLKRFGPDQEIIFFLTPHGKKSYITFAFTNGTWFQLQGTKVDKEEVVFNLKSAEPYFRKSFKGTTEELRKLLKDHAAGKVKLPPLDEKEKPGFGPEYAPKKGASRNPQDSLRSSWGLAMLQAPRGSGGQLFGVIAAPFVIGPLAILALLFPSIFGGVFVLLRQWLAFITLISSNGMVFLGHALVMEFRPGWLRGTWWSTDAAVWFTMTLITGACALWAWRRQLNALSDGDRDAPPRTELLILGCMSAIGFITLIVLWCISDQISWSADLSWTLMVVMTLGIAAGAGYKLWTVIAKPAPFASIPVATEGIIIATMLVGHLVFVPAILGGNVSTAGDAQGSQQSGSLSAKVAPVIKKWDFTLDASVRGNFASPPVVHGDQVFAAYSLRTGKGVLVRFDRQTGKKDWECFGGDDDLRQMFSTPTYADGKLYFGEGFHFDKQCRVFCIDAKSGDEVWAVKTEGQTESSPTVVNGKVFIGAGNDGLYCLDAAKGTKVWRYPPGDAGVRTRIGYQGRIQRFGGGISVVGDRLYCGTGVDRAQENDKGETAIFCFDVNTGLPTWKTPAPLPIWSTPIVKDGLIYVTSGNGDVLEDAKAPDKPAGALQCLDAGTGKELWRVDFPNGVIGSPAVDGHRIYLGCRDGNLYCVNRADGKERWKRPFGSPIVASPILDCDPALERSLSVFAISTAGKVGCLNPQNGEIVWQFDLTSQRAAVITPPRLVVTRTAEGFTRQLYFGCGLGAGTDPLAWSDNRPAFFCLEDKVHVD